ncbi:C2 calcium-dependent membrane-targeting protein [Tanacetum coccineum]
MDLLRSTLELTLTSVRSFKNNTNSSDGYVVCSIADKEERASVNKNGASEPIEFTMTEPARQVLVINIKADENDITLGQLHVPVQYLSKGRRHEGKDTQFVTYQVRGESKELGWSLRFSYRFGWNYPNEDYMGVKTVFYGGNDTEKNDTEGNYTKFECDGFPTCGYMYDIFLL